MPSRWTCSSLRRSRSKAIEPLLPLTSQRKAFLRPVAKRVASIVPTAPPAKATAASKASSTSRPGWKVAVRARHRVDLADQVAGEVDHVRAEVAQRARARGGLVEAPDRLGRRAPVLQVGAAEVVDLADLAGLDELAGQAHGRHEAVVEGAHVLDAGGLHALPGLVALVGVAPQRLLADDVLAGLRGGDRRLGVEVVGPRVVEQADALVGDQRAPVGHVAGEAVARARPRPPPPRCARRWPRGRARSGGGQVM